MHTQIKALYDNLTAHLLGAEDAACLLLTGLLAEGHVLIQGPPGVGKTSLAKILAGSIDCAFRRLQFTPDLLPADVLGYTVYDQSAASFVLHKGPVFSHIVLADEINRASPRVQSALLECMSERQVSIDGTTHALGRPFLVIATENNMGSAGTFPLPDSQLDRFMLSFEMPSPDASVRVRILRLHVREGHETNLAGLVSRDELLGMIAEARRLTVNENLMQYIGDICAALHAHPALIGGPSPRATIGLMHAARAYAYINGAPAVYPDHVKELVPYLLRHRLTLANRQDHTQGGLERVIREVLDQTLVPTKA